MAVETSNLPQPAQSALWGTVLLGICLIGGESQHVPATTDPIPASAPPPELIFVSFPPTIARPPLYPSADAIRRDIQNAENSAFELLGPLSTFTIKPMLERALAKDGLGRDLIDELFDLIDTDGDGTISRAEFDIFRDAVSDHASDPAALADYIRAKARSPEAAARLISFIEQNEKAIVVLLNLRKYMGERLTAHLR